MQNNLLATKLYIPQRPINLVPRLHLLQSLDQGVRMGRRLTIISAPAGYGKTTLLVAWIQERDLPTAWISLDEGDNDVTRFLTYLIAALQKVHADPDDSELFNLQPTQEQPIESVLTAIVNALSRIPDPFLIVLDDYHIIQASAVHVAASFLLEHLPPQAHLVIATRADPPLPLARLRGRGQLTELRMTDLRFTEEEVAKFLNQITSPNLTPEDIVTLSTRTEGWIAGLQMAAISLQGREDTASFIQAFAGSHRYILDYLVEEVLQRQPDGVQSFLLQTAILDRLSGPLCDAVLGDRGKGIWDEPSSPNPLSPIPSPQDSQEVLEYLESANLFLVPLDDRREWYRYHRLFADLLGKRLRQTHPKRVTELHRRASLWYQRNGFPSEAIKHALSAEDYHRAADLIEQAAEAILTRGEIITFEKWINQLPGNLVHSRPYLDLYYVTCLVLSGQPLELVDSNLERLKQHQHLSAEIKILRAHNALFQAEFPLAEEISRKALERLPVKAVFFRNLASWIQNICQVNVDDLNQRGEILEALVRKSQAMENLMFTVTTLCQLAEVRMNQGRMKSAWEIYQQALEYATSSDGGRLPIAGQAMIGLGTILYELNDLEEAARHLEAGIDLIQQWRAFGAIEGYVVLAMCRQAQGDTTGAQQAIHQAQNLAEAFDATEIDDRIVAFIHAQLQLKQGDPEAIRRYLDERVAKAAYKEAKERNSITGHADSLIDTRIHKYEQIALARAFISQHQPVETLAVLDPLLNDLEKQGRTMLLIEVEILRAVALQNLDDHDKASAAIERALSLAEPGGYVRPFIDEGEPVQTLLQAAGSKLKPDSRMLDYIKELLSAFGEGLYEQVSLQPSIFEPATLVEPLTEREMEVLRYLRSSLTVPEIATELYIAESTVRSHVKSIYGKLSVHRRVDAVKRAQELHLLPE